MENYLSINTPSGLMSAFCASSENENKKSPVVIVLQEAFGVNPHIKDVCRKLSQEGFLALAPELYHRTEKHLVIDYGEKDRIYPQLAKLSNKNILEDLQSVLDFLTELPTAEKENVFVLGFCIGGFAALLAATSLPLKGCISFYGAGVVRKREGIGVDPILKELSGSKCPLLLFYGEKDVSIPAADRYAIQAVLDDAHIPHTLQVFSDADHGFFCAERKVYHQPSSELAWERTLHFLKDIS